MQVVPGLHFVERIWDTKVYVLFETDRLILVDTATPGRAGAVWQQLASMGYAPDAVDEIWLTHADVDHMGSVAALKEGSGAKLVAHVADAPLVDGSAERQLGPVPLAGPFQKVFNWAVRHMFRYQPTTVDRTVKDGDRLGEWHVVHTPGHTPGSVSFYHPERKIILVGDALNHRRGKLGAPPRLYTPDMGQAHRSIAKIAALDVRVCCFGHGPPLLEGTADRLRAFAESL
jgi:glyoxylase-like metal-dependent hydrolase (beta-lactamase superfamily II)